MSSLFYRTTKVGATIPLWDIPIFERPILIGSQGKVWYLSEGMSLIRCAVPLWQRSSPVFTLINTESSAMIRHCQKS